MNFIADVNGVTIGVWGVDVFTSASTFNASIGGSVTATLARTFPNASRNTLDLFIANTNTALSGIAGDLRTVEAQNNFTKAITDATEKGLGALVDADLAKASSRLQAQHQLATQAITIANQAPGSCCHCSSKSAGNGILTLPLKNSRPAQPVPDFLP